MRDLRKTHYMRDPAAYPPSFSLCGVNHGENRRRSVRLSRNPQIVDCRNCRRSPEFPKGQRIETGQRALISSRLTN